MSTIHQTALRVIDAYNSWDIEKMMAVRAPECIQEMRPASLGIAPMNNEAYKAFQMGIMPVFRNLRLEVLDTIEDTVNNKVTILAKSKADTVIGPYENEYMITFHMNKEGDKIVLLREFADSAYANEFFPKLKKLSAGKGAV